MYIVAFCEAFSNSIILTSMWSYLKYMDDDVETTVMGQLTGMQGLLALVSCIACGSVSSRIGCKIPLIITSIAALGSNIVYVIPYHIESQQITLVYISRALAGISGGCLAIARVYLSVGTTILERTTATSHFVAAQMLGYTVGPVLQMAYVPIGEEGFAISTMSLNVYTLPAVTNTLLVSLTLVCIFFLFKEVHVDDITTSEITRLKQEDSTSVEESSVEKVSWFSGLDIVVTVFLNLLFAATVFTFGVKSTVAAPYGMHILGWSRQLATRNFSMIMFTLAGLAIFVVMILGKTSKLIDERVSLSIGMVLTIISSVLLIPFGPGSLERPTIDVNGTSANNGEGGCPWKYSWCDSTPAMPVAQYVTALSIQGFGYPMLQSTAFFIYAKTLQPKHQGLCMGVFSAMGNIGRLTGSLYGGYAYFKYGVQWAFGSSCIIISTMGIGIILLYPRLIPYTERKKQKDKYEEECYL